MSIVERLRVDTNDGKYAVVQEADGKLHALRYGEPWRELVGDNLVGTLAYDLHAARNTIETLVGALEFLFEDYEALLESSIDAACPHHADGTMDIENMDELSRPMIEDMQERVRVARAALKAVREG